MNLRDLILATPYVPELASVSVPQWAGTDGKLFVRTLSAHDDERFKRIVSRHNNDDDNLCLFAETTALVLVDENGQRVFTSTDDVKALGERDPEPLATVWNAFMSHRENVSSKKKTPPSAASNTN